LLGGELFWNDYWKDYSIEEAESFEGSTNETDFFGLNANELL